MKIMPYLCQAKRQVWVKAYASSLDKKLNVPSRDIQFCQTNKSGALHVQHGCLSKQHDLFDCVYLTRTARQKVSIGSVNKARKCLVKSGKVTLLVSRQVIFRKLRTFYEKVTEFL